MKQFVLHDPWWLLALGVLPLVAWLRGRRHVPVLLVPFAAAWYRPSLAAPARWPMTLAMAGMTLLIAALARPQRVEDKREVHSQGYDIMLCVDVSGSMTRHDGRRPEDVPSRLDLIKPIIQGFIEHRPQDRIGLVLFGKRAYTLAPLTFDHDWIEKQLARLKIGMIEADGTVIGDGLGIAISRLNQSERMQAGQRLGAFVVLLTDGGESRNAETGAPLSLVPPLEDARIAHEKGIPIYTIGVGRNGIVWEPYDINGRTGYQQVPSDDIDPELLRRLAEGTGGHFFRAENKDTIQNAFDAIDRAKKIEFQAKSYLITSELFWWLAIPGVVLLAAGALAARPMWRTEAVA